MCIEVRKKSYWDVGEGRPGRPSWRSSIRKGLLAMSSIFEKDRETIKESGSTKVEYICGAGRQSDVVETYKTALFVGQNCIGG